MAAPFWTPTFWIGLLKKQIKAQCMCNEELRGAIEIFEIFGTSGFFEYLAFENEKRGSR
jgi:hypothetical protein